MFLLVFKIFFSVSEISMEMFRKTRHGKWCLCHVFLTSWPLLACFLSREPETRDFFVSFSKDVFLYWWSLEEIELQENQTWGGLEWKTERKGKPWRANWREFIWQLVVVPRTQPDLSCAASYSRFLLPLWELAAKQVWSWQGSGLPFLLVRRWQVHIALHSDREHPQLLWLCVCLCGSGVARSSVSKCV